MSKEMLINTVEGRECRIAIVNSGHLEELYTERVSHASRVGNIYKGRVTNVEAAIQAAFVDFGSTKNGFLHISDVHPQYFGKGGAKGTEAVGRKRGHRDRPPIQDCLRRGQEVVVQMTKEGIGTKGPTMTTYVSIPGRLLVMMPGMSRLGVSRKIEDEESREKIKQMLGDIKLPPDMGVIVRTAGEDRSKRDLQRDLTYLMRLWKTVSARIRTTKAPVEIYKESDLVTRTIRDVYNADIGRIVCDTEPVALQVSDFLDVAVPRAKQIIEIYVGKEGLFHDYGLEAEIEKMYSRRVELKSGGSLVIDQTEALVAIDVNSGRFREHSDAETTAFKMNQEAAEEIARQLRLRDLGGVIIIDFIDMREEKNRRAVEKTLREAIKPDRAKTKVLKISQFGIVEMTRQRIRPSLKDSIHRTCTHCLGTGMVKSEESLALSVMRDLQRATSNEDVIEVEITVTPAVAYHLSNHQRRQIARLEAETGKTILVRPDDHLAGNEVRITCRNNRGSEVAWQRQAATHDLRPRPLTTMSLDQLLAAREQARIAAGEPAPAPAIEEELPSPFSDENDFDIPSDEELDRLAEQAGEAPKAEPSDEDEEREAPEAQGGEAAPAEQPQPQPAGAPQGDGQGPEGQTGERKRRRRRGGRRRNRNRNREGAVAAPGQEMNPPAASATDAIAAAGSGEGLDLLSDEGPADHEIPHAHEGAEAPEAPGGQAPAPAGEAGEAGQPPIDPLTGEPKKRRRRSRGGRRRGGRRHRSEGPGQAAQDGSQPSSPQGESEAGSDSQPSEPSMPLQEPPQNAD